MRTCDGCKFCCWSYGVSEVPKEPLSHCAHECGAGCSIHADKPSQCREFDCPYIAGDAIHRPDTFQPFLEELGGNLLCYVPYVPLTVSVEKAKEIMQNTRSIHCAIKLDGWKPMVLSLDQSSGAFGANQSQVDAWDIR